MAMRGIFLGPGASTLTKFESLRGDLAASC